MKIVFNQNTESQVTLDVTSAAESYSATIQENKLVLNIQKDDLNEQSMIEYCEPLFSMKIDTISCYVGEGEIEMVSPVIVFDRYNKIHSCSTTFSDEKSKVGTLILIQG